MAFTGNSSTVSGMAALIKSTGFQSQRSSATSGALPAFGTTLPGTGFETLPSLALSSNLLKFLKSLSLISVGLGLECVPFHSGWELVEWRPNLSDLELHAVEVLKICEEALQEKRLWASIFFHMGREIKIVVLFC